jgi:hypothetical protein
MRPPHKMGEMILSIRLDLKQIERQGRGYPWRRPARCRCGGNRLWGHGFVQMIFDGFAQALQMRRYRCPVCGCIIRLRPEGYFPRHQSAVQRIRGALAERIAGGRWPADSGAPGAARGRHWLRALKKNALAILGVPGLADLCGAFDRLIGLGRVPVRRAI